MEGEVVYLGTFNMTAENMGPDLDLAAPAAMIGGPGAGGLRAARYRNGSISACYPGIVPYPLEFDGAPFDEEPGAAPTDAKE